MHKSYREQKAKLTRKIGVVAFDVIPACPESFSTPVPRQRGIKEEERLPTSGSDEFVANAS